MDLSGYKATRGITLCFNWWFLCGALKVLGAFTGIHTLALVFGTYYIALAF